MPIIKKFDRSLRTFETRVTFVRDIFTDKHDNADIMAQCIQHKLSRSLASYLDEIQYNAWQLHGEDPIAVLKRIDK